MKDIPSIAAPSLRWRNSQVKSTVADEGANQPFRQRNRRTAGTLFLHAVCAVGVQRHGTTSPPQEEQMAERDRFRNDERWSRDDDWRREGGSYRSGSEARRGFGEGNEDYYRSRDFGPRGEFGRGGFGRRDYGRSGHGQGRGGFGRDYGRGRAYGSSFADQSFGGGDYGRDFGRGDFGRSDWNRSDFDRPEAGRWSDSDFSRDQRGTYGGLGYGGSRSSFGRYGEGG